MTKEFKVGQKVRLVKNPFERNYGYVKQGDVVDVLGVNGSFLSLSCLPSHKYAARDFELATTPNGVDGNGKPVALTLADLKPFQRIVFQNGETGVVGYEQDGRGLCICMTGAYQSWVEAYLDPASLSRYEAPYLITEVYAPPHVNRAMNSKERGDLVFSRKDFAAEERAAKLAVADAEIAEAEAKLASARAAKAAI